MASRVYCNGGKKKKTLRFILRFLWDFIFIFGISDMLVHQHCALLKSAGWVFFLSSRIYGVLKTSVPF